MHTSHDVLHCSKEYWLAQLFTKAYLSCDCKLVKVLITHWTVLLVLVVEYNRHAGLSDSSLTLLVHQFLQAVGPHLQECT